MESYGSKPQVTPINLIAAYLLWFLHGIHIIFFSLDPYSIRFTYGSEIEILNAENAPAQC